MLNRFCDDFGVVTDAIEGGALDHNAGEWFRAGEADDDAAGFTELFAAVANGGLDLLEFFQRTLLAEPDVYKGVG